MTALRATATGQPGRDEGQVPTPGRAVGSVAAATLAVLDGLDAHTRLVCGYHLGFWDAAGTPLPAGTAAGGKGVRARLAILSARAAGDDGRRGVPAAVAVDLVHNFSLLHDDVMDGDRQRRHRPAAWTVFGLPAAILAGDAMLALAGEVLAATDGVPGACAVRHLYADVRRLIVGQSADLSFERRSQVGVEECLAMAADKTGALLSCAASLGAVLCGAPDPLVRALARYGVEVGVAFQLVDDLLGIWGSPQATGKPVLADLRARKKSAPVAFALASGTPAGERLAQWYAAHPDADPDADAPGSTHGSSTGSGAVPDSGPALDPDSVAELAEVAGLVEAAGGRTWTRQRAADAVVAATRALDEVSMPPDVRAELIRVAQFVMARDH